MTHTPQHLPELYLVDSPLGEIVLELRPQEGDLVLGEVPNRRLLAAVLLTLHGRARRGPGPVASVVTHPGIPW